MFIFSCKLFRFYILVALVILLLLFINFVVVVVFEEPVEYLCNNERSLGRRVVLK
jgi:uncharacterized protein YpmS